MLILRITCTSWLCQLLFTIFGVKGLLESLTIKVGTWIQRSLRRIFEIDVVLGKRWRILMLIGSYVWPGIVAPRYGKALGSRVWRG